MSSMLCLNRLSKNARGITSRKLGLIVIALLIVSVAILVAAKPAKVMADTSFPMRILEITENGTSDLNVSTVLGGTSNITFDTYSMKKFVALRGFIDGKYDAIYIGKGIYNPTGVAVGTANTGNDAGHNTTAVLNDITNLKANEIITNYINKNLPVIFYNDSATKNGLMYQGSLSGTTWTSIRGKLYNSFSTYFTTPKSNVIFISSTDLANKTAFLNKTNLLQTANIRPRLDLTTKPIDYTVDQNNIYISGDTLTYRFNVGNVADISQRHLVANLYIGIDYVLSFGADQLIATQPITSLNNNVISFRLPAGYSGLHYWKLEIEDQTSKLKDTSTGLIRFRDKMTLINVLQVLPSNSASSKLNVESNLKQAYLKSADYEITVTTTDIDTFNASGYKNLNGKYDMIIFGFTDSYNNYAPINENASIAVKGFIATGQSVMFTHDTIFNNGNSNNQNWLNYFQAETGQIAPWTNMGYGAPQTSTTTKKVNDGILTQFPFYIGNTTPLISQTHDQYYTLDLENPNIIPWYNITGGTRDTDDSWNHYYTYSKGNVTYSGSGHTSANFPDWEQKLFVNTMYRAFIGSNHAPTLTVYSPVAYSSVNNNIIPSYSDILLSFKADDYDLNDTALYSTIKYKINPDANTPWTTWKTETVGTSGNVVNTSFTNPLPEGGNLTIQISTRDKSNATVTKEISVKIAKVTANLEVSRTLSANVVNSQVEKNSNVDLTYTITPKPIPYTEGISAADLVIKSLRLQEILPADMEIVSLPTTLTGQTTTGSLTTGFTVAGNIPNIQYRLDGNNFIADKVVFTITVKPNSNKIYLLDKSKLTFNDFNVGSLTPVTKELLFNTFSIQGITKLISLSIGHVDIAVGDSSKYIPSYGPADASNTSFTWSSSNPAIVSINATTGNYTGVSAGTAQITVRATDGSGLSSVNTITVIQPGINITGLNTVNVGNQINLDGVFVSAHENVTSAVWSVTSGSSNVQLIAGASMLKESIKGLVAGTSTITLNVTTLTEGSNLTRNYSTSFNLTVKNPITKVTIQGPIEVIKASSILLTTTITPIDGENTGYVWQIISGNSFATLQVGSNTSQATITGVNKGSVVVKVTVGEVSATYSVEVKPPIESLQISGPSSVKKNNTITLTTTYLPTDAGLAGNYSWSIISGASYAQLTPNGSSATLTGTSKGKVTIQVTADGKSKTLEITVIEPLLDVRISGDTTVYKGSTIPLSAVLSPTNADTFGSYSWSFVSGSSIGEILGVGSTVDFKGLIKGTSKLKVSIDGLISKEFEITVKEPVTYVEINGLHQVAKNKTITLTTKYNPDTADLNGDYTWTIVKGESYGQLISNGASATIKGIKPGPMEIKVSLDNITSAIFTVNVVIPLENISIESNASVYMNKSINLTAKLDPVDATIDSFSWTITKGSLFGSLSSTTDPLKTTLTGNAKGDVYVTVTVNGVTSEEQKVTIKEPVTDVEINGLHQVAKNKTITLTTKYNPDTADLNGDYTWTIVKGESFGQLISNGASATIKGIKPGTMEIKVSLDNITSAIFKVNVVIPLENISIESVASVYKNNSIDLTAMLDPVDATIESYSWTITKGSSFGSLSSTTDPTDPTDPLITTLTGKAKGDVYVTVTVNGVTSEEQKITIKEPVTKVNIIGKKVVIKDSFITLSASYLPTTADLDGSTYKWEIISGNSDITLVPNGATAKITGKNVGTTPAKVKVTFNGQSQTQSIEVKPPLITSLELPNSYTLAPNRTFDLFTSKKLKISPDPWSDNTLVTDIKSKLEWTSNNDDVVSVINGIITSKKEGTAKITVKYTEDPRITASIIIKVVNGDFY